MNIIQVPKYNNSVKNKTCVVCGSEAFAHYNGIPYCRKHYHQIRRGGIKERTNRDANELIDMGNFMKVVLYDRTGAKLQQFGLIDKNDLKFIDGKRIGQSKYGDKNYCYINVNGSPILLHRYIWLKNNGKIPSGMVVDHINGNPMDNRKQNLRLASALENSYNLGKKDKYTGVNKLGENRYAARIMHDRKDYHLGTFPTLREALDRRLEAEKSYFGKFGPNVSRGGYNELVNYASYTPYTPGSLIVNPYENTQSQGRVYAPEEVAWYYKNRNYRIFSAPQWHRDVGSVLGSGRFSSTQENIPWVGPWMRTVGWAKRSAIDFISNDYSYKQYRGNLIRDFIHRTGRFPTKQEEIQMFSLPYSDDFLDRGNISALAETAFDAATLPVGGGLTTVAKTGAKTAWKSVPEIAKLARKSMKKWIKDAHPVFKNSLKLGSFTTKNVAKLAIWDQTMGRVYEQLDKLSDDEILKAYETMGAEGFSAYLFNENLSKEIGTEASGKITNFLLNHNDDGNNVLRVASKDEKEFNEKMKSGSFGAFNIYNSLPQNVKDIMKSQYFNISGGKRIPETAFAKFKGIQLPDIDADYDPVTMSYPKWATDRYYKAIGEIQNDEEYKNLNSFLSKFTDDEVKLWKALSKGDDEEMYKSLSNIYGKKFSFNDGKAFDSKEIDSGHWFIPNKTQETEINKNWIENANSNDLVTLVFAIRSSKNNDHVKDSLLSPIYNELNKRDSKTAVAQKQPRYDISQEDKQALADDTKWFANNGVFARISAGAKEEGGESKETEKRADAAISGLNKASYEMPKQSVTVKNPELQEGDVKPTSSNEENKIPWVPIGLGALAVGGLGMYLANRNSKKRKKSKIDDDDDDEEE